MAKLWTITFVAACVVSLVIAVGLAYPQDLDLTNTYEATVTIGDVGTASTITINVGNSPGVYNLATHMIPAVMGNTVVTQAALGIAPIESGGQVDLTGTVTMSEVGDTTVIFQFNMNALTSGTPVLQNLVMQICWNGNAADCTAEQAFTAQ